MKDILRGVYEILRSEFDKVLLFVLIATATITMIWLWLHDGKEVAISMQRFADNLTGALITLMTGARAVAKPRE